MLYYLVCAWTIGFVYTNFSPYRAFQLTKGVVELSFWGAGKVFELDTPWLFDNTKVNEVRKSKSEGTATFEVGTETAKGAASWLLETAFDWAYTPVCAFSVGNVRSGPYCWQSDPEAFLDKLKVICPSETFKIGSYDDREQVL